MIYFIFLISICMHELGHIITSKLLGVNFGKTTFFFFGFFNSNINFTNTSNIKKILILCSGPICNFIFALALAVFRCPKYWTFTNLFLGILNLFPIIPLDGGNIMICVLNSKLNYKKAIDISLKVSFVFLVLITFIYGLLIIILKNLLVLLMIIYIWYIFLKEEKNFNTYLKIEDTIDKIN